MFVHNKHSYTITGLDMERSEPVAAVRDDGATFGFPEQMVIDALESAEKASQAAKA